MPMYELQCVACKTINEFLIGLSEMPKINASREVSLKSLGMKCKKTKFKKLISSHGKMASNWSGWQNPPPKATSK